MSELAADFEQEDRDAEIARLLHEGITNRDISARLHTSHLNVTRVRKQLGIGREQVRKAKTKPVEAPPPRVPAVVYPLPVVSQPSDTFRCGKYACVLTARACLIRQSGAGGPKARPGAEVSRTTVTSWFNAHCASGECAQGNAVAEQLKGRAIEPPRGVDWHAQAVAKRRKAGPLITAAVDRGGEVKVERASVPPRAAAKASPPRSIQPKEQTMPKKSKLAEVSDDDFRKAYEATGYSIVATAKKFDVSQSPVRSRVLALGLPRRTNGGERAGVAPKPPRKPPPQRAGSARRCGEHPAAPARPARGAARPHRQGHRSLA